MEGSWQAPSRGARTNAASTRPSSASVARCSASSVRDTCVANSMAASNNGIRIPNYPTARPGRLTCVKGNGCAPRDPCRTCRRQAPLGRRSRTRTALPCERGIAPGVFTTTSVVIPIIDLM